MFIGHYGPAVWDTQRGHAVPLVRLWQAFLAVQAMDIVFSVIAIFGHEGVVFIDNETVPAFYIPWSHSFLSAIVIAVGAGLLFKLLTRSSGWKGALVIMALAFSHWPLDWLVHRPDLPLHPWSQEYMGLSLWDYAWASYALEVALLGGAVAWWLSVTRGPRWTLVASWALVAALSAVHFGFITEPTLLAERGAVTQDAILPGPVFGVLGLATFVLIALAIGLIERHRVSKFAPA